MKNSKSSSWMSIILLLTFTVTLSAQVIPKLEVDGDVLITPNLERLAISNIGSSGLDGINFEALNTLRMTTLDPTSGMGVILDLNPNPSAGSFFDVFFEVDISPRLRLRNLDRGAVPGVGMLLGFNQAIEAVDSSDGKGFLRLSPNFAHNGDNLVISNIGSSGDDGVRLSARSGTVQTEILSMDLSSADTSVQVRLGDSRLVVSNIGSSGDDGVRLSPRGGAIQTELLSMDLRTADTSAHLRLGGGPFVIESAGLTTTYEYDALSRITRTIVADPQSATSVPVTLQYDNTSISGLGSVGLNGHLNVFGQLTKGGGAFKIDHPLDPYNKYLYHSFVESPDMMNIYNGNITTDEDGLASVTMPEYFSSLNKDFRYQLTVIGEFAQAIIKNKIVDGQFVIQTDKPNIEVSWQVTGVRNDIFARENPIMVEVEKGEREKGSLLYNPRSAFSRSNQD